MDHLKKLGVACLLVTAAMAVAGAGAAFAEQSVFCKVNETPCGSGDRYASGAEFVLKSKGPVKWVGYWESFQIRKVECLSAEFLGKITNAGGGAETVEVSFTTQFLGSCNAAITTLQTLKMKFNWTSGTMNGSVATEGFHYGFDGSGFTCSYGSETSSSTTLTGGAPASLTFTEAAIPVSGGSSFVCGKTATFDGEFEVSAPNPLYVANA